MNVVNKDLLKERIVCAAVFVANEIDYKQKIKNIELGLVVCGRRHHDCFRVIKLIPGTEGKPSFCGFLTNTNRFVNREDGYVIAKKENQIWHDMIVESKCPFDKTILCSEDLYYTIGEDF